MEPDPFSALLEAFADMHDAAQRVHADLVRGDKAMALLAQLVAAIEELDHPVENPDVYWYCDKARAFLAASPAIPPGDGDA